MHEPTDYEKAQQAALECLCQTRYTGAVNHLLEDPPSTNRVRQILCFLSEVTLQAPEESFSEAMTHDATEGLGWILRSCHEALGLIEGITGLQYDRRTAEGAKVSRLTPGG